MTDATIQVDYDELEQLARRLQTIHDRLGDWDRQRPQFAALGDSELVGALQDFYDHWDCGFAEVRRLLERTIPAVRAAARAYRGTDTAVAHSAATLDPAGP